MLKCPRNRKQLYEYIRDKLGYTVPDVAVADGNISPFDFIYDIFFEKVSDVIVVGSRGSGKTLDLAIIHILNSIFKAGCETVTAGAIEKQAKRCYSYFQKMLKKYAGTGRVGNSFISETIFHTPAKVEILTATMNQMNFSHPQKAFLDEFDLVEWAIFMEFLNMTQKDSNSNSNIIAQNVLTTTYKYPNGSAVRLIRQREEMGFDFKVWSIWEASKRCTLDSCSHCENIVKGTFSDGSPRTFARVCGKKLKRSNGFLDIKDVWRRFKSLDIDIWLAQQECRRPSRRTAVFYWFDPERDANLVFNVDRSANFYEGIDWGGASPNAYVLWMEKNGIWYLVDEIYVKNIPATEFADMVKAKRSKYGINNDNLIASYADPENTIAMLEFEKKGINLTGAKKGKDSVIAGVAIMNSLGTDGRIKIHARCKNAKREFTEYHYSHSTVERNSSSKPVKIHCLMNMIMKKRINLQMNGICLSGIFMVFLFHSLTQQLY